jgi:hypothetical protein
METKLEGLYFIAEKVGKLVKGTIIGKERGNLYLVSLEGEEYFELMRIYDSELWLFFKNLDKMKKCFGSISASRKNDRKNIQELCKELSNS